jgi:superfamily II DNA/RNA helicase
VQALTAEALLGVLPKERIVALGRDLDVTIPSSGAKERQIQVLVRSGRLRFRDLLRHLGRDELKAACRAHGLDDTGRARIELQARLLKARGNAESAPPAPLFSAEEIARFMPRRGDIVMCRHRQWLVDEVVAPPAEGDATRVRLVCLDDDASGRIMEVLWELELGARVHKPEAHGLGAIERIDPPRHFAAYLNALRWSSVTATDPKLFQAPFRAGIKLDSYQLTPLMKALKLPRANLFIADDVGLGKTIEAGLVLSELILRQRVDMALIVCPASVTLQWRDEMFQKFGLHFEVMSRAFVAQRRKERGFAVNPWATHQRFIVSHQLLRRPEYRDPLLNLLGERARKSLLILDEAHVAAPANGSAYAVDSRLTKVLRDIAPRFDNRLFLSATPHNGHSNSFSSLLELLDAHRFTRGVPVSDPRQLEPVMVRRLKQDLRDAGISDFPVRRIVQLGLRHDGTRWQLSERAWDPKKHGYSEPPERALGAAEPFELGLAEQLGAYTELACPKKGRARLAFVTLQKRLLSSVEAFARTLEVHAEGKVGQRVLEAEATAADAELFGLGEETLEAEREEDVREQSAELQVPSGEAKALLQNLRKTAERFRAQPDAKVRALLDWIARHQCAGVRVGGRGSDAPRSAIKKDGAWTPRRLIIFTEYGDTKRYLMQQLNGAIAGTERADERIMQLHGGMDEERRAAVQRAFQTAPDQHPVRILVCTDAAREGLNLQAHCADMIHFDVPWNPGRLEQRNGRIDRTLQPAKTVHCQYFSYAQRGEDPVLATLVEKTQVITRELGSLAAVVMDDLASELEREGIRKRSKKAVMELTARTLPGVVAEELESTRSGLDKIKREVEDADQILQSSRKAAFFDPALLKEALDVGFELAGAAKLERVAKGEEQAVYELPALPDSWQTTLDALRPPRERDEAPWEWRQKPPQHVTFEPMSVVNSDAVQLHLQHPVVQRVLGRFLAQGFSMGDLSRVTVVRSKRDALVRVIAFGRLSLFGAGAARLHDELIPMAARWFDTRDEPLKPLAEEGDRRALEQLDQVLAEAPTLKGIPKAILERVQREAATLFQQLWKPIREEADARARAAIDKLKARGHVESEALTRILQNQQAAIKKAMSHQLSFDELLRRDPEQAQRERDQLEGDKKHMQMRLAGLTRELETEPLAVRSLYDVVLHRLQPVGLVVLWPESRLGANGGRS